MMAPRRCGCENRVARSMAISRSAGVEGDEERTSFPITRRGRCGDGSTHPRSGSPSHVKEQSRNLTQKTFGSYFRGCAEPDLEEVWLPILFFGEVGMAG